MYPYIMWHGTAGDEASPGSSSSSSSESGGGGAFESDGEGGVRLDLQLPRRSLLVKFTCNKCSGRSERLVNPIAWQRGMVSWGGGGGSGWGGAGSF